MYKKNFLRLKKAVHSFRREMKADPYRPAYAGTKHKCSICNSDLAYFKPVDNDYLAVLDKYEFEYSLFQIETFNFLNYSCPKCNSCDRDRLYALYFQKRMANADKNKKYDFVDFAPQHQLSLFFRKSPLLNYRTADLFMEGVDDRVDITDMNIYKDNSFDIFVCSHVLEHVPDDRKGMRELHRILRPGGWGIAMVPIWTKGAEIIENLGITTDADKWKYYGQDDHVRMYNHTGFVNRLKEAGFKVNELGIDYFGAAEFELHGIHPRSILYIVEKL